MGGNKQKLLIFSILILLLALAVQAMVSFWLMNKEIDKPIISNSSSSKSDGKFVTHQSFYTTADFYDEAYQQAATDFSYSDKVRVGILPHHLMVKGKIATFFEGLKKQNIKTIVLVGPNHFEQGVNKISISQALWQTPYGDILPDTDLAQNLAKQKGAKIDEEPFAGEHAISGLVPFIKKSLPDAKLVSVILKSATTPEEAKNLAANIKRYSDGNTLVLASVDFSHYLPAQVADFHDDKSRAVIENLDEVGVWLLEVDSPASLAVALHYANEAKVEQANLLWQTNSSRLIDQLDTPGTSHQFYYFTKGDKKVNHIANFLFFGDIMLDRNVGAKIVKNGFSPLLENLAGQENRFFRGSDVVMANLEGAVTDGGDHYAPEAGNDFAFSPEVVGELKKYNFNFFNIANNHLTDQGASGLQETRVNLKNLDINFSGCADAEVGECTGKVVGINGVKVAMLGFSMVYHNFDLEEAKKIISEFKKQTDLVIVSIHWGTEYEHEYNTTQSITAHALSDSGADVIIGHHPHVVQGLEIYNNKPIFYSLGNFIFDQYFSADTQTGLSLGLSIDAKTKKGSVYLFPLYSEASKVILYSGQDKANFLEQFYSWSTVPVEKKQEILEGKINL
jgi:poly-gamma-glutamate synthesis protein (capsule biosynthesis protein)